MSQNLLSNIFKPVYVYDSVAKTFSSRLELLNIDKVSANQIYAFSGSIGDAFGNVYVGTNAGNSYANSLSNANVVAMGVNAGQSSSNCSNSVFIGYNTGAGSIGSSNTIAIGANTLASGAGNIYIGANTGSASGTSNIFIGQGLVSTASVSNTLLIGGGSNCVIGATMGSSPLVGIGSSNAQYTLDVNGYARIGGLSSNPNGGLGINTNPVDYTLNVNGDMQVSDGYGTLRFTADASSNSVTTIDVTGSYAGAIATLQVTGGFFSARGTTSGASTIPLKKGMFMVSAFSNTGSNTTRQGYVGVAANSTDHTTVSSSGGGLLTSNATYLAVASNTTWTVTYFPSP